MTVILNSLPKVLNNPKHTIEPLWAKNAGRNSNSGKFSGSFVGWFDKIEVPFGKTTYAEMEYIREQLEHPIITCTFLDSRTNALKTEDFYGTAVVAERNTATTYKPTSITLVAVSKRSDM